MNAIVKIAVSEKGLIKNLKSVFSTDKTFVRELLQNARRSGATEVHVTVTDNAFVIRDNGCGIDDFQSLLTLAESGWTEQGVVVEKPFGMGFFSALFAGESVKIFSKGKVLKIDTAKATNFEDLHVVVDPFGDVEGTHITIKNKDGFKGVLETLKMEACAFPIPVFVNGEAVDRKIRSILEMPFHAVERADIGRIAFNNGFFERCWHYGLVTILNGSVVGRKRDIECDNLVVVDVDPRLFMARMPDRDVLLNEREALEKIEKAVREEAVAHLIRLIAKHGEAEFLRLFGSAVIYRGYKEVWNHLGCLYSGILSVVEYGCPVSANDYYDGPRLVRPGNVSRQDVEEGKVIVCKNFADSEGDIGWIASMLAARQKWVIVNERSLNENHWATGYVVDLSDEAFNAALEATLNIREVDVSLPLDTHYAVDRMVACEGYSFEYNGQVIEVNDKPLIFGAHQDGDQFSIVIPLNSEAEDVAALLMSFNNDDGQSYWDDAVNDVEIVLADARGSDFGERLTRALGDGRYSLGQGKRMAICLERSHDFAFDCTALIKDLFVSNPEAFAAHLSEEALATLTEHINRA